MTLLDLPVIALAVGLSVTLMRFVAQWGRQYWLVVLASSASGLALAHLFAGIDLVALIVIPITGLFAAICLDLTVVLFGGDEPETWLPMMMGAMRLKATRANSGAISRASEQMRRRATGGVLTLCLATTVVLALLTRFDEVVRRESFSSPWFDIAFWSVPVLVISAQRARAVSRRFGRGRQSPDRLDNLLRWYFVTVAGAALLACLSSNLQSTATACIDLWSTFLGVLACATLPDYLAGLVLGRLAQLLLRDESR